MAEGKAAMLSEAGHWQYVTVTREEWAEMVAKHEEHRRQRQADYIAWWNQQQDKVAPSPSLGTMRESPAPATMHDGADNHGTDAHR